MEYFQDLALNMINFLIPFLLGSLIFFSAVVAPTTFVKLDKQSARKFIRGIFPKLYLWSLIISMILTIMTIFYSLFLAFILLIVSFGFFFSRQYLVKWINSASDSSNKVEKQIRRFKFLHTISVLIFTTQIVLLLIVNYYI